MLIEEQRENSGKGTRGRPFKKGKSGNPNGRPKGSRDYATIYRETLKKMADSQDVTAEELEDTIIKSGLLKALKGDYRFYRDALDRLHGKPKQAQNVSLNLGFSLSEILEQVDALEASE